MSPPAARRRSRDRGQGQVVTKTALLIAVVTALGVSLWFGYALTVATISGIKTGVVKKRDGFVIRRDKDPTAFRVGLIARGLTAFLLILIASMALSTLYMLVTVP
jgi:hypothetical protein